MREAEHRLRPRGGEGVERSSFHLDSQEPALGRVTACAVSRKGASVVQAGADLRRQFSSALGLRFSFRAASTNGESRLEAAPSIMSATDRPEPPSGRVLVTLELLKWMWNSRTRTEGQAP